MRTQAKPGRSGTQGPARFRFGGLARRRLTARKLGIRVGGAGGVEGQPLRIAGRGSGAWKLCRTFPRAPPGHQFLRDLLLSGPRPPELPAERPGVVVRWDNPGRGATTSRSRTISTTVLGGSITPAPQSRTTGSPPPSRLIASRCSATSSAAEAPLRATSRPPIAASGRHQPASRSRGATARAVTTSTGAGGPPARSSARPRTTVTAWSRSSVVTASDRNAVRRASGSTSVMRRSGRATASTIPGKPAPDPTSITEAP